MSGRGRKGRRKRSFHDRSANKAGYCKGCSGKSIGRTAKLEGWAAEKRRQKEAALKAKRSAAAKKAAATRKKANKAKAELEAM